MKARSNKEEHLRNFQVPDLNLDATTYYDMINWQECQLTEPPITVRLSDDEVSKFALGDSQTVDFIQHFPCHTQAVERAIKLVTEASLSVAGEQQRDGLIKNKLTSRSKMAKFDSKKDFRI